MLELFILFWIVCGVLSYGLGFAYLQREYPIVAVKNYHSDMVDESIFALLGPFALFSTLFFWGYTHGLKFK